MASGHIKETKGRENGGLKLCLSLLGAAVGTKVLRCHLRWGLRNPSPPTLPSLEPGKAREGDSGEAEERREERRADPSSGRGNPFPLLGSQLALKRVLKQVLKQVFAFLRKRQRCPEKGWSCCCCSCCWDPISGAGGG